MTEFEGEISRGGTEDIYENHTQEQTRLHLWIKSENAGDVTRVIVNGSTLTNNAGSFVFDLLVDSDPGTVRVAAAANRTVRWRLRIVCRHRGDS